MRAIAGFLLGAIFGLLCAGAVLVAFTLFSAGKEQPPLLPAAVAGSPEVTVTMGELYLNQEARAWTAAKGINFGDIVIDLHPDNRADVNIALSISVLGQTITLRPTAAFHFAASGGLLVLVLDHVNVAGIQVPQNVVDQQFSSLQKYGQDQINAELQAAQASTGLRLVGLESTENTLTLRFSR